MTDLPANVRWQLWIVAFGFFMQSLDTTIVNTALDGQKSGESPLHMHMVIVSYVLTVAVMLPASGWLADKVGVRNIFSPPSCCLPSVRCFARRPTPSTNW
jgi:DHA2 family multidrug resistance protein-like MFS transporter